MRINREETGLILSRNNRDLSCQAKCHCDSPLGFRLENRGLRAENRPDDIDAEVLQAVHTVTSGRPRRKDIREVKHQAGVYELWTRRSHGEYL